MQEQTKPTCEELQQRLKAAEAELHHLNRTLERRVSERTTEAERRSKQLQKLARKLSNTEERERQRIAAILHDDLQQLLAALRYRLKMLTSAGPLSEPQENHAQVLGQQIDDCIEKARGLSHELSPPTLRHNGLVAALKWLVQDIKEKHGQTVVLDAEPNADPQSPILPYVLYRSVRELLFNSRKHSGEKTARIAVGRDGDHLIIRVADDGSGGDLSKLREKREKTVGLGLFAIQERIHFLGGEVDIDTAPGRGFRVTIRIPDEIPEEETALADEPGP
ncbi:MAG: sensor histidine kinase [Thermodesulfobacteriota bacterium]